MVYSYFPLISELYQVWLTTGGDKLDCTFDTVSPVASLFESSLLLSSVISDAHKGVRFMTLDKRFFLVVLSQRLRVHAKKYKVPHSRIL